MSGQIPELGEQPARRVPQARGTAQSDCGSGEADAASKERGEAAPRVYQADGGGESGTEVEPGAPEPAECIAMTGSGPDCDCDCDCDCDHDHDDSVGDLSTVLTQERAHNRTHALAVECVGIAWRARHPFILADGRRFASLACAAQSVMASGKPGYVVEERADARAPGGVVRTEIPYHIVVIAWERERRRRPASANASTNTSTI